MSSNGIPLLNDYKKKFLLKRIPQTLLGGPNLHLGYSAPCYVHLSQIVIWLLPWVISGIFTIAVEVGGLSILIGSLLTGCLIGLFVLVIQATVLYKISHKAEQFSNESANPDSNQQFHQLISDEDEIFFSSFCSLTTFKFVVTPLKFPPCILIHAIFSGLLSGVGFWYTLPSILNSLYNNSVLATVFIYIFSWISHCIAHYPLNSGGIPELAVFRSVDRYDVATLSRSFHVFVFFSFHIVEVYVPSFQAVNQVLHIVFLFLPLFWLSGVLPPLDALLFWIGEQVLIFGLGGSTHATDLRFLVSLILSGAVLVGASFISSISVLVFYSAAFGFLLSTDFISLLFIIFQQLLSLCSSRKRQTPKKQSHYKDVVSLLNVCWHVAVFALLALTTTLGTVYRDQALVNNVNKTAFYVLLIALLVVCKFLQDVQRVFVVFRFFRNCLYPAKYSSNDFKSRKSVLNILGYTHMIFVSVINPLVMVAYLSLFLFDPTTVFFSSFVNGVGSIHAFRMVWQRSNNSLSVFAVFSIIKLIISSTPVSLGWFDTASVGIQLLVLDVCIDRVFRFSDDLWFAVTVLMTSWTDKKQRRATSLHLLILNLLCFPIVTTVVAGASVLSAPLLPLFTLPLFYIAFPRPARFWPQTPGAAPASTCVDTGYYDQMAPGVTKALARGCYLGVFSTLSSNNSSFLVRSQDKTFWIQTLESGYGYVSYSVKGLELQETSCHALEATRLDDACDNAFEKPDVNSSLFRTNPYPFTYAVTPLDTVFIKGYSDAKNSLAGIIDYPVAIKRIHKDFVKSLTWILYHHICNKKLAETASIPLLEDSTKTKRSSIFGKSTGANTTSTDKTMNGRAEVAFATTGFHLSTLENGLLTDIEREKQKQTSAFTANQNGNNPAAFGKSSSSLQSLASILSTDDEAKKHSNGLKSLSKPAAKPPGFVDVSDDDDISELDSELSDSGFGVAPRNVFAAKKPPQKQKEPRVQSRSHVQKELKNDVTGWGEVPTNSSDVSPYKQLFDRSWYLHVAALNSVGVSGVEEDEILNACREVTLACYVINFVQGVLGKDPSLLGPNHMCNVFNGKIPWSPYLDWLLERPDLHAAVLQAQRYAIKMMYDRVVMGTVDDADDGDHEETVASLREFDSDWYIGPETSRDWKAAVEKGVPSLFAIHLNTEKDEYSARILLRRSVAAHVCRLSSAAVRSTWANLNLELLYATNDDEERYSIQAHSSLLRNLTTQAADPPLGYPIFSSPPLYEVTLPLPTLKKR